MSLSPSPPPPRPPTQADVARLAGVSKSTVSAIFRGDSDRLGIAQDTRRRVFETAERLRYRPNSFARGVRTGRFFTIAYVVPCAQSAELDFRDCRFEVIRRAENAGYRVSIIFNYVHYTSLASLPPALKETHFDGIIAYWPGSGSAQFREFLATCNRPVVFLNDDGPRNCVRVDDRLGATLMAEHLLACGYRRIGYCGSYPSQVRGHYSDAHRFEALSEACSEGGATVITPPNWGVVHQSRLIDALLDMRPEVAIFCNDGEACYMQRNLYRRRLRVPDDIGVASFNDDSSIAGLHVVPLTTVRIPFGLMAAAAVDMCVAQIEGEGPVPSQIFPPELVVRESTRCVQTSELSHCK